MDIQVNHNRLPVTSLRLIAAPLIGLLALTSGVNFGHALTYLIEGNFEYAQFARDGQRVEARGGNGTFQVTTDYCAWNIRYSYSKEVDFEFIEAGVNNAGEVYLLQKLNAISSDGSPSSNDTSELFDNIFHLGQSAPQISKLWLAFGSACYFGANGPESVPPILIPDTSQMFLYYAKEIQWPVKGHLFPGNSFRLPKSLEWSTDGNVRYWDNPNDDPLVTGVAGFKTKALVQGGIKSGYPFARYGVSKSRDINGVHIPTVFAFEKYFLALGSNGRPNGEPFLGEKTEFHVTGVHEIPDPDTYLPNVPTRKLSILDRRFATDADQPVFMVNLPTMHWPKWPTRQESLESEAYQKALRAQRGKTDNLIKLAAQNRPRMGGWLVVVSVAGVLSVGLLFLLQRNPSRRSKTKTQ